MKKWVTSISAIDPRDGVMKKWCGPEVIAETHEEAQKYCEENELGYCKVMGLLICEIPWSIAEKAKILYTDSRDN